MILLKKQIITILYIIFFLFIFAVMLKNPQICLSYATKGLMLWFNIMIPTLLPFMILSGILIRMRLAEKLAKPFALLLRPIWRLSDVSYYAMLIGFLCGFPMGAHCIASLYQKQYIQKKEATLLLSFCNNLGPVFFTSQVLLLQKKSHVPLYIIGMYGIPLLYGLLLRNSLYKEQIHMNPVSQLKEKHSQSLFTALDESVYEAMGGMTRLGGYMIFLACCW